MMRPFIVKPKGISAITFCVSPECWSWARYPSESHHPMLVLYVSYNNGDTNKLFLS